MRLQPAWLVSYTDDNPYNRKTRELLDSFQHMEISENEGNIIFPEGNAIKYLWRAGLKHEEGMEDKQKEIEDLQKILRFPLAIRTKICYTISKWLSMHIWKDTIDVKLLVLDGNSIVNRAFYGIRLLTNKEGIYTNAIYGFLNILFKYLTEEKFNCPVFVYDWPKDIKAFYMKQNEDGKTVAAVDLEVPGAGELMGGSQREEDYDKLVKRMEELGMEVEGLDWYLNLRKFGGCVHSGFGMGFERLLIYLTGVENIRDVIPFPRTPGNCEF